MQVATLGLLLYFEVIFRTVKLLHSHVAALALVFVSNIALTDCKVDQSCKSEMKGFSLHIRLCGLNWDLSKN